MSDAFLRYLLLLREIPTAPQHVHTATLARRLEEQGICVTRRTIQRDLERLSSRLPLKCNDSSKPYGWAWHESSDDSFRELVVRVARHVEPRPRAREPGYRPAMPRPGPEAETVHRLWTLLRLIPRRPRRADTGTLKRQLDAEGIDVTARSIQRDLQHLAARFPNLHCDERSKPYGWSWDGDVPLLEIPGMGLGSAVTFELVQAYLAHALPRSTLRTLDPYFARAREVIRATASAKLARWPSKVRVLPRGFSLRAPAVPPRVLDVVYSGLLEERRLRAHYRARHASETKSYEINPLGLVVRDGTLALVCTFWDYDDPHYVLLHRMTQAELLDTAARRPKAFDLDSFLARGGVGFVHGDPVVLEAVVAREVAITLHETPLSTDQVLTPVDEGRELVRATVPNTLDLRGWLQSYGPLIEVKKPLALRNELAKGARQLARMYGKRAAK